MYTPKYYFFINSQNPSNSLGHNILQPEPAMSSDKTFDETSWPWHTICLGLQSLRPLEVICQLYVSLRLPHFRKVTISFQRQKLNAIMYASRGLRQLYNGYFSKNETFLMTHTADKCELWRAQLSKWNTETVMRVCRGPLYNIMSRFFFSCMDLADKVFKY